MKHFISKSLAAVLLLAWTCPLSAGPAETVTAAAKKLKDSGGYSWSAQREGSRFWTGTLTGKVRKDGAALVTNPGRDDTYLSAFSGEQAAAETQDGWQSASELENAEGFARFLSFNLRRFQRPADEILDLVKHAEDLTEKDGVYSGKLKAEKVEDLISFGGAEIRDPNGSISVTIKAGQVVGYKVQLKGGMSFNGNDVDVDRATTVEISKIGETDFEFPAGAKSKLKG